MQIIDQYGNPIDRGILKEPQTSRIASLQNQYLSSSLGGLTPARLVGILKQADDGDLTAQHRLFADMEERDTHLLCEIGKRKLAVMDLDWDIVPPRNASAAEKSNAEWLKEVLTDAVDPLEDLLLALMDGVCHGFAAVELEWRRSGAEMLPAFHPRPQEWFRLDRFRKELRLLDASADGAALLPFGWVLHTHGKAKTGYLGRMGLHRALVWPFLYKAYSLGDFAEFLETYGLPIVLGKYYNGASADEKASLMRAVTALGHDARAIMPADMQLEINKVTADGSGTPHLAMIDWADRAQSKAILGQTTSSEARTTGLGSGVATVHNEVRRDIRNADARQIAGTLTRDLIYPLLALNKGGIDSLSRCPRLVFDTGEPEDIAALADGIEKLTKAGMKSIPVKWVHEKLRIPEPEGDEAVLGISEPIANPLANQAETSGSPIPAKPRHSGLDPESRGLPPGDKPAALAALSAVPPAPTFADQTALDAAIDAIPADNMQAMSEALLAPILQLLDEAGSFDQALNALARRYPQMDSSRLEDLLARALFAAELWGYGHAGIPAAPAQPAPAVQQVNLTANLVVSEEAIAALAAAQPKPPAQIIENHIHVPEQPAPTVQVDVAAPNVSVTNDVQPAPVNTVVTPSPHPARAVQTVERDPQTLEVTRTVTDYES